MRVETIGDATLYNGDCREIIPMLRGVNAVCTDPPYGIENMVGGYGRSGKTILNDENLDACAEALRAAVRIAPDALFAVFHSPRNPRDFYAILPPELHDLGELIWDKKAPGLGRDIRYQHEPVAVCYTGMKKKLSRDTRSVLSAYHRAGEHPHEKPTDLIRTLCELIGGTTILDPFMGSGTCGVACANVGKRFIGIELDPKYFDIACERIAKAVATPTLFGAAANDNTPAASLFAETA